VTECGPTDNVDVTNAAHAWGLGEQELTFTGDPKFAPSITNCTVPVGLVVPEAGAMVAVNVTDCPKTEGLAEDMTVVVVFIAFTVSVAGGAAALAVKFEPVAAGL